MPAVRAGDAGAVCATVAAWVLVLATAGVGLGQAVPLGPYAPWKNGPGAGTDYFPIAVWLQEPALAPRYKAAGINLYVGLWQGPTREQLAALADAGMSVVCAQNQVGLAHRNDPTIVGWMHGDEPDNAQELGGGKGYGPPIPPARILADYAGMRRADPSRPVLLNLGQGVAYDNWVGRGVRRNHPEDYAEYVKGGDIVSFDIYPVVHSSPEVAGKLWFVADGVARLKQWTAGRKIVWNCIECTHISSDRKPTPAQVRAEVWMSLIHGSSGLIYFAHEWKPKFNEHALLDDPQMLSAVTAINTRIHTLAPVLSSPSLPNAVQVSSSNKDVPVAVMVKRQAGMTYLFAVAMRDAGTRATYRFKGLPAGAQATVLHENRTIPVDGGAFADDFEGFGVHLYQVR